jgi:hypothetical protein
MKQFEKALTGEMGNYFEQPNYEKICEQLETGSAVWLYCWCSGHTRCEMVNRQYLNELYKKYGDKLKKGIYKGFFDCYYLEG